MSMPTTETTRQDKITDASDESSAVAAPLASPEGERSAVGRSLRRVEDIRLLTGRGCYVADLPVGGALSLRLVRSPVPHGRLGPIVLPQLPEGCSAFTAADLGHRVVRALYRPKGQVMPDWPLLAFDKVRYVGEPIVAVLAPDPYLAEDLAEMVELEVDELDPVVDPFVDDPALLHDGYPGNVIFETQIANGQAVPTAGSRTIRRRFRIGRHSAIPMETRGCLATFEGGQLTVWSSSQIPDLLRLFLADVLSLDPDVVHVNVPDVGGGFGVKGHAYPDEALVALLALRAGRPVRWIEDRAEHLMASIHARDEVFDLALTVSPSGELVALEADVTVDSGAYPAWPQTSALEAQMSAAILPGPYRLPSYRVRARSVCTNKAPFGTYRGVARPGVTFALERLMDEAARELGVSPVDLRARNLVTTFPYESPGGLIYDAGSYLEALQVAAEAMAGEVRVSLGDVEGGPSAADGHLEQRRLRGIGFACFVEQSAHVPPWARRENGIVAAPDRVVVAIDRAARVSVHAGLSSHGQGQETTLSQVAADRLGVSAAAVTVAYGRTDLGMYSMGTLASRSAVVSGNTCAVAAERLAATLRSHAAAALECAADDVRLIGGKAVGPKSSVGLGELVQRYAAEATSADETTALLRGEADYDGPAGGTFSNAVHAAAVSIDPATGVIEVERYVVVEDCGRMINPMIVNGQIQGGVAQGIGSALYEQLVYDEHGQLVTTTFMDYRLPSSVEIPRAEIHHLETPSATVLGTKGMGESGAIGPMAAIGNALADALGPAGAELVTETPFTPPATWALIREARNRCQS